MEASYGILSLLPVAIALFLAFWKKNVFIALLAGLFSGALIISVSTQNFFVAFDAIANVFSSSYNTKTIFFLLLTGAIVYIVEVSGGVEGLILYLTVKKQVVKTKTGSQLIAFVMGILIFVDGTSSIAITALVGKPFFEKYKMPKEKLALISNTTGSPIAWIVPFGGAGALLTSVVNGVLPSMGIEGGAFTFVMQSVKFQFYSIFLLLIVFATIVLKFEIGPMKKLTEEISKDTSITPFKTDIPEGKEPLARNMVVPLVVLIISIFSILFYTGKGNPVMGDGATAVFTSGMITLFVTCAYFIVQKIATLDTYIDWCFVGMKNLFPIVVILSLAFAFGEIVGNLGTAAYIASFTQYIPPSIILFMVLLICSIISFSSGSSSAAVILLIPIMLPIAYSIGIPIPYVIGAVVSGAVFGDQCSPISDSAILTSTVNNVDIMDHVRTQLPYAAIALGAAAVMFIVLGFTI